MMHRMPLVALSLRGMLDRRRTWLMVLLAAMPVLTALAVVVAGGPRFSVTIFDNLVIRTVVPLIALVFGSAALGSDLEDGTIVYLLTKPVRRLRIYAAKGFVAAGLASGLVVVATLATGIVASAVRPDLATLAIGYAMAAAVGATAYALAFITLSMFTTRALALGLGYVLLWEGILSGLLEGTRVLSIRQATLGLATEITGTSVRGAALDGSASIFILVMSIVGAIAIGTWRLSRFQLRGGD